MGGGCKGIADCGETSFVGSEGVKISFDWPSEGDKP